MGPEAFGLRAVSRSGSRAGSGEGREEARRPSLIPKPGQLLMMASLRDAITGNDWTANPAALKGRAVEETR